MVLKHTVQLMPGHTVWINVVGQSQKQVAVNFSVQDCLCTNDATMPEECTELVPAQSRLTVKSTYSPCRLGNPKAAAHVAVRPSVLVTVKC